VFRVSVELCPAPDAVQVFCPRYIVCLDQIAATQSVGRTLSGTCRVTSHDCHGVCPWQQWIRISSLCVQCCCWLQMHCCAMQSAWNVFCIPLHCAALPGPNTRAALPAASPAQWGTVTEGFAQQLLVEAESANPNPAVVRAACRGHGADVPVCCSLRHRLPNTLFTYMLSVSAHVAHCVALSCVVQS
jgi:hypothetical protein